MVVPVSVPSRRLHQNGEVSLCLAAFDNDPNKGRIFRQQRRRGGGQAHLTIQYRFCLAALM
jgi:hypothetical protein